jgi:hypothetical protein
VASGSRLPLIHVKPTPVPPTEPPDVPGVTWDCASDPDTHNHTPSDCTLAWTTPGGDYGPSTAPATLVQGPEGTVVSWDVTADVLAGVSRWLLRLHDETSSDVLVFYSDRGAADVGDPEAGPVLVLE